MKKIIVLLSTAVIAFALYAKDGCCKATRAKKPTSISRAPDYAIEDFFVERRSLYAMSGESITDEELLQLFEAARWAPSSYNEQPWRFIYAKRETPEWNTLFELLVDFNKKWTSRASALVLVISRNNSEHNGKSNPTHSFDTGAAWENIALQAYLNGLVAHGMGGFDYARARKDLNIPDDYTVEMMFAVGKRGTVNDLPEDMRTIDDKASQRKTVTEIAFTAPGPFTK